MKKVTAVIQARTGSTRYPGKVLRLLAGKSLIEHIIIRLQQVTEIDQIVLAIPDMVTENSLADIAKKLQISSIRGSEEDVLARFIQAGDSLGAKNLLRICGDSPFTDLSLVRSLIDRHLDAEADYTFSPDVIPLGTGAEVARLSALKKIAEISTQAAHREHVTTYFHEYPHSFRIAYVSAPSYLKGKTYRLTINTEEDFRLIEEIYRAIPLNHQPILDLKECEFRFNSRHQDLYKTLIKIIKNNPLF
jgi:spore coat polysaccharide biosynthesis protein SpsF